jgi:hypothetical protein
MYKITFEDNTIFVAGQNLNHSQWNEMPEKRIKILEYFVNNQKILELSGYEAYCHLIEKNNIIGSNSFFENIIILGKFGNESIVLHLSPHNGKIIKEEIKLFGKEYKEAPVSGWKQGLKNETPGYKIY